MSTLSPFHHSGPVQEFTQAGTLGESYQQRFGVWGGKRFYRRPTMQSIRVSKYGTASVSVEVVSASMRESGVFNARVSASLQIPDGGSNLWTADELKAFAAKLLEAAAEMQAAEDWLSGKTPQRERDTAGMKPVV